MKPQSEDHWQDDGNKSLMMQTAIRCQPNTPQRETNRAIAAMDKDQVGRGPIRC